MDTPHCHRCGNRMTFQAQQVVGEKPVDIFRCEKCDTLEAVEAKKAA